MSLNFLSLRIIRILFFVAISLFFLSIKTYAQFEANVTKGCAPLTVTLTSDVTDNGVQIKYRINGGAPFDSQIVDDITLNAVGVYSITQIYQLPNEAAEEFVREDYIEVVEPEVPQFEVVPCSGFTAKINITDTYYDFYVIDFGDGTTETVSGNKLVTHTYADGTAQDIIVKGGFTDGGNDFCGEQTQSFTPQLTINPGIIQGAVVVSEDTIELSYELPDNVTYILQENVGGNNFFDLMELDSDFNSTQLPGRDVKSDAYCYRIITRDACNNTEVVSDDVCVVDIEVTAGKGENVVTWPNLPVSANFEKVNVYVDNVLTEEITNTNQNEFTHSDVTCNVDYCYFIEVVYSSGIITQSSEQCVTAQSAFEVPELTELNASVEGENIELTYLFSDEKSIKTLEIYRAENGGDYEKLPFDEIDFTSFTDTTVNVNANQYCYRIFATDFCDNVSSDSLTVCTVLLSGEKVDDSNELSWTSFVGFPFGFSYTVEIMDEQGNLLEEVDGLARNVLSYSDFNDPDESTIISYRVKVVADHDNSQISYSNTIVFIDELVLEAPEAFTPNNDGLNDTFYLRGQLITEYQLSVFTRWGELIFSSNSLENGWDGTINGKEAPAGPYSYVVKAKDLIGNETEQKGLFMLIR